MKKIFLLTVILTGLVLGSCQKNDEAVDVPGNIPGMGDNNSALEVTPITLPENITVVEAIKGYEDGNKSASTFPNYKIFGGSGEYIKLAYTVRNDNNYPVTIFLPAGTIFKSTNTEYQHGILLQWTWFCVPAKSERTVVLYLFCINKGKNNSDASNTYHLAGKTISKPILELLGLLKLKMVNYEFFNHHKSSSADQFDYEVVSEKMQEALWALTNDGTEVSSELKAYIKSLPELDTEKVPAQMLNESADLEVYLDEYTVE